MKFRVSCGRGNPLRSALFASATLASMGAIGPAPASAQTTTFNFTGGAQTFSVLATGSYRITIAGAQGGNGTPSAPLQAGGAGAVITGDYTFTAGESLNLIVGGQGGSATGFGAGGGGGGSFVFDTTLSQLIVVAGGGGGGGAQRAGATGGQLTTAGSWGGGAGAGAGGDNGAGGQANPNDHGGGGGGFLTAGQNSSNANGGGAYSSPAGGTSRYGRIGGYGGGGGSSSYEGGGGGGYSGGGGGSGVYHYGGGGGGSFEAAGFSLVSAIGGSSGDAATVTGNRGNGYIILSLLQSVLSGGGVYNSSSLGGSALPDFRGGRLKIDLDSQTYGQAFTVDSSPANTIDQNGKAVTFSGAFSDAGSPGSITIANSAAGGGVTFAAANTYTGPTTIDAGARLALSGSGSVASSSVVVDNGVFDVSAAGGGQASVTRLSGSGQVNLGAVNLTLTGAADTFSGTLSGAGGLTLTGGTQTLSGASTYTGATTIDAGARLALSGSGSVASSSAVVADGVFDISAADGGQASITRLSGSGQVKLGAVNLAVTGAAGTFSGTLSGAGGLTLTGGTQTLGGTSTVGSVTVAGGTLIVKGALTAALALTSGGTLQGDSASLLAQGAVTDDGALVFDQATDGTFANAIAGTGVVTKQNSGRLVLTGASTVGQTTVVGGTLVVTGKLSSGLAVDSGATLQGSTSSLLAQGTVIDNGALVFDQAADGAFANAITGSGALTKQGGGILALNGVSTVARTTVGAGNLQIGDISHPQAQLTSAVSISAGATLSGHGAIVGAVTNDGVVSPGGSIGILSIAGDYAQSPTGALSIELNPQTSSTLAVTGRASLAGGLVLLATEGVYRAGKTYTLVSAGTVTGGFSQVSLSNNLPFTLTSTGTAELLTLTAGLFPTAGGTANQNAVGIAFVDVPVGHADFDSVADVLTGLPSASRMQAAAEQTGGEIAADTGLLGRDATRRLMSALDDQMFDGALAGGGAGVWGRGFGGQRTVTGDGNTHGVATDGGGALVGAGTDLGRDSLLGATVAFDQIDASLQGLPQSARSQALTLGLYGERRLGFLFLDAAASAGVLHGDTRRTIAFSSVRRTAAGAFTGVFAGQMVSAGARWRGLPGLVVEPSVSLIASQARRNAYAETGAGDLDLLVSGRNDNAAQVQAGLRAAAPFSLSDGSRLSLQGRVAWTDDLSNRAPAVRQAYAANADGGFTLAGADPGARATVIGGGVGYQSSRRLSFSARYDRTFGDHADGMQVSAAVRWTW